MTQTLRYSPDVDDAAEVLLDSVDLADALDRSTDRELVERLAHQGGWTASVIDGNEHFVCYSHPDDATAKVCIDYSKVGEIEAAEYTTGQQILRAHARSQVVQFLKGR